MTHAVEIILTLSATFKASADQQCVCSDRDFAFIYIHADAFIQSELYSAFRLYTCYQCKARLDRPNDGSRSAGEGLCVLQSFLFTTQQEH